MNEEQAALIAEQMRHAIDLLKAEIRELRRQVEHLQALDQHRLTSLERQAADFETRIRAASDGVTQFKMFFGLATGGSSLLSLAALLRSFFGV
jgi:hypothetical protein